MSAAKGLFITCEGGEGVGKSSFLEAFLLELKKKGVQALATREPGGSPVGEAIRTIFSHPPQNETLTPEAEFMLVSAARIQHVVNKIKPNLHAGTWVICDRYLDSSLVYQGVLGGLDRAFMDLVIQRSTLHLLPHTTFLLDCPVEVSLARIEKRRANLHNDTRFDKADRAYHSKIREAYLELANEFSNRYVILDAQVSTEKLVELALQKLEERSAFVKKK